MWTWCTREEWNDMDFDLYWNEHERSFSTEEQARKDAEEHAKGKYYIIRVEGA